MPLRIQVTRTVSSLFLASATSATSSSAAAPGAARTARSAATTAVVTPTFATPTSRATAATALGGWGAARGRGLGSRLAPSYGGGFHAALADGLLHHEVLAEEAALHLFLGDAAPQRLVLYRVELGESEQSGAHQVDRVVVADRLGEHVVYARGFEHGTHAAARNHACTRRGGPEEYRAGSVRLGYVVRDCVTDQGHADHVLACIVPSLADRVGHFGGLACACAHRALPITDHDDGAEVEASSALHHLGYAVDLDQLLLKLGYVAFYPCHYFSSGVGCRVSGVGWGITPSPDTRYLAPRNRVLPRARRRREP